MADTNITQLSLTGLTPQQAASVLTQTADLAFVLDADNRIAEVHAFGAMAEAVCPDWTGRAFAEIPGIDSRPKVTLLLADDASQPGNAARWRHLNIARKGQETLPLLLKFFAFAGPGRSGNMVVARDLRPTMAMQARVQRAMIEMEMGNEWSRSEPAANGNGAQNPVQNPVQDPVLSGAVGAIGRQPLDRIVADTSRTLERLCIAEALRQAGDDAEAAAGLLGITRAELEARLAD